MIKQATCGQCGKWDITGYMARGVDKQLCPNCAASYLFCEPLALRKAMGIQLLKEETKGGTDANS
jgi:hypothetical protein